MARLPLNIGLNPFAQQRRQILGERLLGAESGVDPSARSYVEPRVGITATTVGGGTETYGDTPFRVPYAKQPTPTVPMGLGGIQGLRQRQEQATPSPQPQSMLAKIRSGLGASPTSPMGMALDSAAQSLLQQSGYSPVPRTTGQIFGEALGAAREGYMGGKALEQQAEQKAYEREKDILDRQIESFYKAQEIQATLDAASIASGAKTTDREIKLSQQFRTASKPFTESKLNFGRILANATTPSPSGATDIALIFNYMKMLDPTSVVRGSEYKAAEDASPVMLRLGALYNQLFTKKAKKLPDETRRMFLQAALETYIPYIEGQEKLEEDFILESENFGLNPDNTVRTQIPKLGTKDYPILVYNALEALDKYPVGSVLMYDGNIIVVEEE